MLKGIDVSNWDSDRYIVLSDIDFLIAKCSEGTYFYDITFESFTREAHEAGKLTGAYHFAGSGDPKEEAEYFYNKVKYYLDICVPFLDFEDFSMDSKQARIWCESFIEHFYILSGVYCGLYISACLCNYFAYSWIPEKCILWVAGYISEEPQYNIPDMYCPYDVNPWLKPSIWQFSSLYYVGSDCFDGNVMYMSRGDWLSKLVTEPTEIPSIEPTEEDYLHMACRVILGEYGIGEERRRAITECGFNYDKVQTIVNEIMGLIPDE